MSAGKATRDLDAGDAVEVWWLPDCVQIRGTDTSGRVSVIRMTRAGAEKLRRRLEPPKPKPDAAPEAL